MDATAAATLFAWLDREIWLITATAEGQRGGLIATFVSQAWLVPELPRVLVCLAKQHRTWELVQGSGRFAMHLLSEGDVELVWRFGLESSRDGDKFAGLTTQTSVSGCPLLPQTIGWLDCRVAASLDIGDRTVYLAEVVEGRVANFAPPLTAGRLGALAPGSRLTEMGRKRHHDSHRDAEAIRAWREGR